MAKFVEEGLETIGTDHFGKIADQSPVQILVMRGQVEVPLVVRQTLPRLNEYHGPHPVGPGDRGMMLGKKIPVKGFVVLGDPTEARRTFKIPKMNVGIHDGNVRLAEEETKQAKAACEKKDQSTSHQSFP